MRLQPLGHLSGKFLLSNEPPSHLQRRIQVLTRTTHPPSLKLRRGLVFSQSCNLRSQLWKRTKNGGEEGIIAAQLSMGFTVFFCETSFRCLHVVRIPSTPNCLIEIILSEYFKVLMAERRGFEPPLHFRVNSISNRAPSATRSPLHKNFCCLLTRLRSSSYGGFKS